MCEQHYERRLAIYCCVCINKMLSYCAILNHTNQWFIIHTYETQQEQQYQHQQKHQTHNGNARFMCMVQFRRWKGDRMRARERARAKARTRCENSSVIVFPFSFILFVAVCLLGCHFSTISSGLLLNEKFNFCVACVMKILVVLVWLSEHNRKFKHAIWLYFWWQKKKQMA